MNKKLESPEAVCTHTHTNNLGKEKGITLVALVVTIVVLLILAGVSINLVLGQNGLISNAKNARNKTLEAEKTEGANLNIASDYIKQTAGVSASGITAGDYGKVVTNYNADGKTWEIFYADESNVYLITRDSYDRQILNDKIDGYNGTSDFDGSEEFKTKFPAVQAGWLYKTYIPSNEGKGTLNYSSNYDNMKATEYLLDSTVWNEKYLDSEKAEWAIGGPTLELMVKSFNKYYSKNIEIVTPEGYGYYYTIQGGIEENTVYNRGESYLLACQSAESDLSIRIMYSMYKRIGAGGINKNECIRPVVCLKSNVKLKLSEDKTSYSIE